MWLLICGGGSRGSGSGIGGCRGCRTAETISDKAAKSNLHARRYKEFRAIPTERDKAKKRALMRTHHRQLRQKASAAVSAAVRLPPRPLMAAAVAVAEVAAVA